VRAPGATLGRPSSLVAPCAGKRQVVFGGRASPRAAACAAKRGWPSSGAPCNVLQVKRYRFGELVFSWDERKAATNLRRHGIRFEEAATVFVDPVGRAYDDPDHSEYELRFLLVGHSLAGRILLVVHAEKDDTIRIISARRATPREREDYEADA
jgi:uncharacterized protein